MIPELEYIFPAIIFPDTDTDDNIPKLVILG